MDSISASVGHQATNRMPDVRTVQALLNRHTPRLGVAPLSVDGNAGPRTVAAIKLFQQKVAGMALADGRVDPAGRTWRQLAGANPAKLSGAAWWHANQAKFPNSADVATLDAGFKAKADKFLAAMRAGGLKVQVRSTRRNKVRAYLMHYSWKIAKGMVPPDKVPPEPGCDIIWDHGNLGASLAGAQQMVALFDIVFQPSLNSRHIAGLAIDMDVSWAGQASVKDAKGVAVALGTPCDGMNPQLHKVGASFGVIKHRTDRPHWSDTGG